MAKSVSRRRFLKAAGVAAVGSVASACMPQATAVVGAGEEEVEAPVTPASVPDVDVPPGKVALVGIQRGSESQALAGAVKDAARCATDFAWLSKRDSVLIKPALNSGNPYPATTSAEAIGAMVELLKENGAGRVIVSDMSGIEHVKLTAEKLEGSSRELMHASGMAEAALAAGAELYFPEEAGWEAFFEDTPIDTTHWKKGIMMPEIIQEVDHVVLMPRCSRHLLLGSSLGLKCAVGYWRTDTRLEYHKIASTIQEKTADANTVRSLRDKQRLVLTAATQILTTLGPDDGFIAEPETGLVIASESIVAHDMVSLAWLLQNRLTMSEEERAGSRDPYTSQFIVSNANRFVVMRLGNLGAALGAEKLLRHDIESIWDDRVLNRAYEVFGGIPSVQLVDDHDSVPGDVKDALLGMVSRSV